MRIYLMARYQRYPEMQQIAHTLAAMGHAITSRWIWGTHSASDGAIGTGTLGTLEAQFALDDCEDLVISDCCIGFSEVPRTPSRGGRFVELGMAIALHKRIIVVGGSEHVFHALPQIAHVESVEMLYTLLGGSVVVHAPALTHPMQ